MWQCSKKNSFNLEKEKNIENLEESYEEQVQ